MKRRDAGLLLFSILGMPLRGVSDVSAAQTIAIGVSLGLTGQFRVPSEMHRRAYELWQDDINARGGLLGRPVKVIIVDDQSNAQRSASIYREFTLGKSVDYVFGPYSSEIASAVMPIVEEAGYPMLAPGASADDLWRRGYQNIFAMLTPASRYTQGMLRLAHEAGLSTFAILSADDAFSSEIASGTIKWASYLQLKALLQLQFPKATADLKDQMRQARDVDADLVMVAGHRDEAVNARRAAADLGWLPRNFFATVGPAFPDWGNVLGAIADGAFSTSIWEPTESLAYPNAKAFANAFNRRFGVEPSYHAATAYAAGQILEAAVNVAGSLAPDAVRSALYSLDTYSILGRFAVDHTGMQVKRIEMIIQWQQGKKEIVWPQEIRTAKAVIGRS